MKRDIVCLGRMAIDSLPKKIRNSRILFKGLKLIFSIPEYFYSFRSDYQKSPFDLAFLYQADSPNRSKRISPESDLNSFHILHIMSIAYHLRPQTILDLGCGSGYLLRKLHQNLAPNGRLVGVDYDLIPDNNSIQYVDQDLRQFIAAQPASSFDLIVCTHTLEHLEQPDQVYRELIRVARQGVIVVCPLEKRFRWGLNYHINFFPTQAEYVKQLGIDLSHTRLCIRLGDMLSYTVI